MKYMVYNSEEARFSLWLDLISTWFYLVDFSMISTFKPGF